MDSKGWGPWRKQWLSLCGVHRERRDGCDNCDMGWWANSWRLSISGTFYRLTPRLWRWWVNR